MINIATIFSGIGIAETALSYVTTDFNIAFACESDKYERLTYLENNKIDESVFFKNIYTLDGNKFKDKIDILYSKLPLKDFTLSELRANKLGTKGRLILELLRVVKESKPKVLILELSITALTNEREKKIKLLINVLNNMGRYSKYRLLNAKDYGIPQSKTRLYIVSFLDEKRCEAFSFAEPYMLELNLGDMLEDRVADKYFIEDFVTANFKKSECTYKGYDKINLAGKLSLHKFDGINRVYSTEGVAPTMSRMEGGDTQLKVLLDERNRVIRRITPRECLNLLGLNKKFKIDSVCESRAYKHAGRSPNANVLEMIYRQLGVDR
jgi:DNA (cytosine-5-)-methyltransferase